MVEDAFYNRFFVIDVISSNNYSMMRAVLKHPIIGVRGQVLKISKGKLDVQIPEPSSLADPSHRIKVVAKHIFYIVNDSKSQRCGCTRADALRLKKDWGYMISGRRYDSSSGHAFIVGARSKRIIRMVLYSKACRKCDAADKRGEESEEHECPKNFEGSSKSMEASAILKMVEDAL